MNSSVKLHQHLHFKEWFINHNEYYIIHFMINYLVFEYYLCNFVFSVSKDDEK